MTDQHSSVPQFRLALEYAAGGTPVFAVSPKTKRPFTLHGVLDATIDLDQLRAWWIRHPDALAAAPTGEPSGFWVLDIDKGGHDAFNQLLATLGCETLEDLSPVYTRTPNDGLHLYFRFEPATTPRTRASDIAANIDTRGLGGSIILPGNLLPDGRAYRGTERTTFDAPPAPAKLMWLATFNARERAELKTHPDLIAMMREQGPTRWAAILQEWRDAEAKRIAERCGPCDDDEGMRRQALSDLALVASEYGSLQDGRREKLFSLACKVARYVAHGVISEQEFRATLIGAAQTNGALSKYGAGWARNTIRSAIERGSRDRLPPLARVFRTTEARA